MLYNASGYYIKNLKSIEEFVTSDPLFFGFDGSNLLLVALDKEISFIFKLKVILVITIFLNVVILELIAEKSIKQPAWNF
jgi:hypothetical protein